MGEPLRPRWRVTLVVLLLLGLPSFPVQAQTGSALLDEASFGLGESFSLTNSSLNFTFEVHEMSGQSANASAEVLVQTLEGATVSSTLLDVANLTPFEQRNVSASISGLAYGYSQVTVVLTGDVGQNTSTHAASLTSVVQRLRPLNVSFAGPTSVTVDGLTSEGLPTGNITLHDGDRYRFAFPIQNNGDVNWTGAVVANFTNGEHSEEHIVPNLAVNGSSSSQVVVNGQSALREGLLTWRLTLIENLSSALGIHQLEGSFTVGPPPLPLLEASLTSNVDAVDAGDELTLTLRVWNNGTAAFSGRFLCDVDGTERLNQSLPLDIGGSGNLTLTVMAKPLTTSCRVEGQRIAPTSPLPVTLHVDLPSAVFESAGSPAPSFSGGPWHKLDTVHGNMLLRNTGELEGRIRLVFDLNGVRSNGDWVTLASGAAGEVMVSAPFLSDGSLLLHWFLESDDGVVTGTVNGSSTFSVASQQSVALSIIDVEQDETGAVEFVLQLFLDEGRSRDVVLQLGYETGDATVYLREQSLRLEPGSLSLPVQFGTLDGERLVAKISAVDWSIGPGALATSTALPNDATEFWLEFDAVTSPLRPVVGDSVSLTLSFHQSGPAVSATGEVWIVDAYGAVLARATPPAWNDGQSVLSVEVIWPKGNTVSVRAHWVIEDKTLVEEANYVSGQIEVDTGVEWPLGALAWGTMLGAGIVLAGRLRYRSPSTSSSTKPRPTSTTASSTKTVDEKREISCPECDRRLRVPVAYEGSVGCPDCTTKFTVEAEISKVEEVDEPTESDSRKGASSGSNDGKIELGCPDCQQTLRIPASYQGSVRCPACTKIFKANEGITILE